MEGSGYRRQSPFEALRWIGDKPLVRIDGEWFELLRIDGYLTGLLVSIVQQTSPSQFWVKRFEEDLVELLTRPHDREPGDRVSLELRPELGGEVDLRDVLLTDAHRLALFTNGRRSPFETVRWRERAAIVRIRGHWYEPVSIDGLAIESILEECWRVRGPDGWRKAFEVNLYQAMTQRGRQPGARVTLRVKQLGHDELLTMVDVPMTEEAGSLAWTVWQRGESHAPRSRPRRFSQGSPLRRASLAPAWPRRPA